MAVIAFLLVATAAVYTVASQSCITFEQTRYTMSTRRVDKTTCVDLQLDALPAHISNTTVILLFIGNRLSFLHREMFTRLPLLEEADFSSNEILHIGYNLTSSTLTNLTLRANKLRNVPNGTFEQVPNLAHLDLSRNVIWILFSDSFRALSKLLTLDLSGNLISVVDGRTFAPLVRLRDLNLGTNLLQSLPEEMNGTISRSIRNIRLGGNSWTCDCRTFWLKVLLTEYNVHYDKTETLCTQASVTSARGRRWHELRYAEFACEPKLFYPTVQMTVREQIAGYDVTLECKVNQKIAVNWKRYEPTGEVVEVAGMNKYSWTETDNENFTATLTIRSVSDSDAGVYSCDAANLAGAIAGNFTIRVLHPNQLESQLVSNSDQSDVRGTRTNDDGLLAVVSGNTVNLLALIGALVGIVVVVIVIVTCIVYCVQLAASYGIERQNAHSNAADGATHHKQRVFSDNSSAKGTPDKYLDTESVPSNITTLSLLPINHHGPIAMMNGNGRYVSIQHQLNDAFGGKVVGCLANTNASCNSNMSDSKAAIRVSTIAFGESTKIGTEAHGVRTALDNPYMTVHHYADTSCPVHGMSVNQHCHSDGDECCRMHETYATAASYLPCPLHGAVFLTTETCVSGLAAHCLSTSRDSTPELMPLGELHLLQPRKDSLVTVEPEKSAAADEDEESEKQLLPKNNAPAEDYKQQVKPAMKAEPEETDIDAEFNGDEPSDNSGMNTIIRKPQSEAKKGYDAQSTGLLQPYNLSI